MIFVQSWRIKEDVSILPLTIPVNYPPILTGTHWLEAVELISDHVLHFSYIRLIPSLLRSLKGHCKSCRKRFISDMPRFNFVDLIIVFFFSKRLFSSNFFCKRRKSTNIWSNRQIWPWSTEWSRTKTNRVLPTERTRQNKHLLSATQEKTLPMDITRWSTSKSDWLYSLQPKMEKLYTVSNKKKDRELTVAQIMNSLLPNSDLNWRK